MEKNRSVMLTLSVLSVWLLALATARAQTTTSVITGIIKDATGAVLPGVTVTAKEVRTGLAQTALSSEDGLYRIVNLPRGLYQVKAELTGFKAAVAAGVELTVNETKRVDFTLEVGEIAEVVTVTGEAPLVATEEGRLSRVVHNKEIVDFPLVTRTFTQLAFLAPGVVSGSIGSNTGGFSIGGARSRSTNFLIDGIDANDPVVPAETQVGVPLDSVQEFRLIRNSMSAEFGRLAGGAISIVTKSGTNELHGTLWEFHRNRAIAARNFFAREKPPFIRNQAGFEVGGPVIKNKTFAYGSWELTDQRTTEVQRAQFFTPEALRIATGPVARQLLQKFPSPEGLGEPFTVIDGVTVAGTTTAVIPSGFRNNWFVVRMDHEWLDGKNRINGRYIFNHQSVPAPLISNTLVKGFQLDFSGRSQNVGFADTHIFSNRLINEFRFGFTRDAFDWRPQNPEVPTITLQTGVQGYGADTNMPQNRFPQVLQFMDTISYTAGKHAVRFGVEVRHIQRVRTFDALVRGAYTFRNEADFLADRPFLYQVSIDLTSGGRASGYRIYDRRELMWFWQDDWKLGPNFTLNYGIRYENFRPPREETGRVSMVRILPGENIFDVIRRAEVVPTKRLWGADNNNFAPRLGFAWDPFGDKRTSIRGGYGMFYERIFQNVDENIQFNPPFMVTFTADTRAGQGLVYSIPSWIPAGLAGGPIPRGSALRAHDPGVRSSYMQSWFLSLQREVFGKTVFEVTYQGTKGTKLPVTINYNRFDGDLLDGRLDRINSQFGPISMFSNMINSIYHSLQIEARQAMAKGVMFSAAYTFSRFIDEDSDNFAHDEPVTVFDIRRNQRGLSRFHTPHRFVLSYIWEMPFLKDRGGVLGNFFGGWQISGITTLQSGRPFEVFTGAAFPRGDMNRDGTNNDRPHMLRDPITDKRWSDGRLDASAFDTNFSGLGSLGRNAFLGPGFANFDFAVLKNIKLQLGEQGRIQFRAEFFNLFNRVNFNNPIANLASSLFGKSTSSGTPTVPARVLQFALKLYF